MIIDLEPIYKKIIYVLVRKNYKIRLRKAEKETIVYDGLSVEDGYNKVVELLKGTKRIKKANILKRFWLKTSSLWSKR